MAGKRKPNPKHITRYEREGHQYKNRDGSPSRISHYDHGIKVPAEHMDQIRLHGFVTLDETMADHWGRRLDEHDDSRDPWGDDYRARIEQMAGETGLAWSETWTVGHIVWPDDNGRPCPDCPWAGQ